MHNEEDPVQALLDSFRELVEGADYTKVATDGEYQGTIVRYKNGVEIRKIFDVFGCSRRSSSKNRREVLIKTLVRF